MGNESKNPESKCLKIHITTFPWLGESKGTCKISHKASCICLKYKFNTVVYTCTAIYIYIILRNILISFNSTLYKQRSYL